MTYEIEGAHQREVAEALAAFIAEARSGSIEFRTDESGVRVTAVAAGEEPI